VAQSDNATEPYDAFGVFGAALHKKIGVFRSSYLKTRPKTPNASYLLVDGAEGVVILRLVVRRLRLRALPVDAKLLALVDAAAAARTRSDPPPRGAPTRCVGVRRRTWRGPAGRAGGQARRGGASVTRGPAAEEGGAELRVRGRRRRVLATARSAIQTPLSILMAFRRLNGSAAQGYSPPRKSSRSGRAG
jgi:hypothetical protein